MMFTQQLEVWGEECIKVAFPHLYLEMQRSFNAGKMSDDYRGVTLGRATLFKLQTSVHTDPNDKVAVMVYSGGIQGKAALLILPQLGVQVK